MKNFDSAMVIIPSHRPEFARGAIESLAPIQPLLRMNAGYVSFSKMINDCIVACPSEIVIICNDKARPTLAHESLTCELLSEGYGFVGLHNFRHFGFRKDLIRRIGFFDERFVGGEYEDFDFMRRIKEADVAVYMSKTVPCIEAACSWNNQKAYTWNHTKWRECVTHSERLLPEEQYSYDIGPDTGTQYKPWARSMWAGQTPPKEFSL